MAPWGRRKSPVPRHTRQKRPEVEGPTEWDPTAVEVGSRTPWKSVVRPPSITTILLLPVFIIIMSCRLHGYPWPSLTTSPYCSSPQAGLQGYIPYPHIAAKCMFELVFARPYVGVHRSISFMNSSLLLLQFSACLVRLTWIVFVMEGRWPYSWCLVGVLPPGLYKYIIIASITSILLLPVLQLFYYDQLYKYFVIASITTVLLLPVLQLFYYRLLFYVELWID